MLNLIKERTPLTSASYGMLAFVAMSIIGSACVALFLIPIDTHIESNPVADPFLVGLAQATLLVGIWAILGLSLAGILALYGMKYCTSRNY